MATGKTDIVEQLNYKTLAEIKTMSAPPKLVKQIMTACCILLGYFDKAAASKINLTVPGEYWKVVKYSMGSREFIKKASDLDPTTIPLEFVAAAKTYLGETSADVVKKVSLGATYYFIWAMEVIANAEANNGDQKSD